MIRLARAKAYNVEKGDQFVMLRELTPAHKTRYIEVRDKTTNEGMVGLLVDANFYLLDGTVAIRFEGETVGIFGNPDDVVLVKRANFTLEDAREDGGV